MIGPSNRRSLRLSVLWGAPAALALVVLPLACRDAPTGAEAREARSRAVPPTLGVLAGQSIDQSDGSISTLGALAGKLPSTDTVTSSVPAFEIKQKGGGIAGRFEITNPNSFGIALDGVNAGSGHALLAWNLGLGRAAAVITSNSNNTLPTLDVSAQSSGAAADIRANNVNSINSVVKATTIGLGRGGEFRINNTGNASPVLDAQTNGRGSAGFFQIANTANTSPALVATTNGTGTALLIDHRGTNGPLATFQSGGVAQARINRFGKGFFNGGTQTGGADIAEAFDVEGEARAYEPGDVLVISTRHDRAVAKADEPYSPLVAGVYATKPGVLLTERGLDEGLTGMVPMGVVGVIPTKVSAENGAIRRGDLLVTAATPGHAMRGADRSRMLGATLGKALEEFAGPGTGVIKVLVNVK